MADEALKAWERLCDDYGILTAAQLAQLASSRADSQPSDTTAPPQHGRELAVEQDGLTYFPAYQFDATGTVHPALTPILTVFRDAGWSDFSIAIWFANPTTWLSGQRPADLLADVAATPRLLNAAQRTTQG